MMTLRELMDSFPTNESCKQFLVERRWPDDVVKCPRCGNPAVYKLNTRPFHWLCKPCKNYRFSVISGTIFQRTPNTRSRHGSRCSGRCSTPRRELALFRFSGRSEAEPIARLGICAIACALPCTILTSASLWASSKLMRRSSAERTRTAIGTRRAHVTGGIGSGKVGVIGAISRKGNVVCQIIENTDADTLNRFVRKAVSDKVDLVATDEHAGYAIPESVVSRTKR